VWLAGRESEQNVEFPPDSRLASTFCTASVHNVERTAGSARISTFCTHPPRTATHT
jgi:hypothetical protein